MRTYTLRLNDRTFTIAVRRLTADEAELEVDGKPYTIQIDQILTDAGTVPPRREGTIVPPTPQGRGAEAPRPVAPGGDGAVTAPIPGLILEVFVKVGESVKPNQALLKMEAMKMETTISAPAAGTVQAIHVHPRDSVSQGQAMMVIV